MRICNVTMSAIIASGFQEPKSNLSSFAEARCLLNVVWLNDDSSSDGAPPGLVAPHGPVAPPGIVGLGLVAPPGPVAGHQNPYHETKDEPGVGLGFPAYQASD